MWHLEKTVRRAVFHKSVLAIATSFAENSESFIKRKTGSTGRGKRQEAATQTAAGVAERGCAKSRVAPGRLHSKHKEWLKRKNKRVHSD